MKKEIIKTDNHLLVVDNSEIKVDDYCTTELNVVDVGKIHNSYTIFIPKDKEDLASLKSCKKIIAHLPLNDSPILDGVPLLPPLDVEEDNKDLFFQKQVMNPYNTESQLYTSYEKGFVEGYNKSREKYKFTEEDIAKAVMFGRWGETTKKAYENFIQSLSQPKTPTHFEFETVCDQCLDDDSVDSCYCHYGSYKIVPKTTTNSQGHLVACGKYICE